jgi:hypothetical protein
VLAFGALMVLALDVPRKGLLFMVGLAVVAAGVVFLQLSAGSKFFGIASVSYVSPDVARTLLCIGASLQLPYLCSADVDHALRRFAAPARALAAFILYAHSHLKTDDPRRHSEGCRVCLGCPD